MIIAKSNQTSVVLTAQRGAGDRTVHQLDPGRSVLVGTSKDCGLQLQGEGLSPCHCLLSLEGGTLWVQDWASTSGTLLNGQPIEAKVVVEPSDELCVGEYRITAASVTSAPFGGGGGGEPTHMESPLSGERQSPEKAAIDECEYRAAPVEEALWAEEELLGSLDAGEGDGPRETLEMATFEQETIALLREEIDLLQGMLAQRDAQLAELSAAGDGSDANCDVQNGGEDSKALMERMEQLLEEAACGDERVVLLEEMLRAAEEANQAEQEERHQLEAWVGDIERRIIQRDEQRNAEVEALRGRLEEAVGERECAQLQLKQAASVGNAPKYYEESLDRLQQQNKSLQEKLAEMAAERVALINRLKNSTVRDDEALREERAAIAQERAIVSRLRSELANKIAALEDSPKPVNQAVSDAATRLQALREHLREIHVEEKQVHHEQVASTLTGRISRIWKRLEN